MYIWFTNKVKIFHSRSIRPPIVIPYSGKLSREKTLADRSEGSISWRKLSRNAKTGRIMGVACLKFCGETFADGWKIAKFVKVFSLESFPLYGSVCIKNVLLLFLFSLPTSPSHLWPPTSWRVILTWLWISLRKMGREGTAPCRWTKTASSWGRTQKRR